ncbi:hypothetical protein SAVCW2_57240 [Streptomyces avermitilis]|nr:hypothetical protein SAVCW2_57240 [Streptomyces avermitilis]
MTTESAWTRWPSREALGREGLSRPRRMLAWTVRALVLAMLLWGAFSSSHVHGWGAVAAAAGVLLAAGASWAFFRTTLQHRLWPSLALIAVLLGIAIVAQTAGFQVPALVIWCGCAVSALERLPLAAALPVTTAALAAYAAVDNDVWLTTAATIAGYFSPGMCCVSTPRLVGAPSVCSLRSARRGRPRRSRRRWRSEPGSRGRFMTCWRTASRRSWCIWRRPGC